MRMSPKFKFFEDMGLCISDGAMTYGYQHGAFRWAPSWFKHAVCNLWNKAHCALAGHDSFGYEAYTKHVIPGAPVCSYCCAKLKIDGRYPTAEEIAIHNDLCHKNWDEADAKWRLENPELAKAQDEEAAAWESDPEGVSLL